MSEGAPSGLAGSSATCWSHSPWSSMQSNDTTAADVMRYWLLLAKHVSKLTSDSMDADFKAHCFTAYNLPHDEMVSPLCQLASIISPSSYHWQNALGRASGDSWPVAAEPQTQQG
ncbi:TPA: hypothetical protein ACH3X1_000234 [Trebouxia sp. C0004]